MATTAIWDVRDNLNRVLDYTSNPKKTEKQNDIDYQYNGLSQVITYTTNDLKTEKQLYVSGINCSLFSVKREMLITKKQFQKTDGILAYHAYQSFAPNEATAETAHQIGLELAQELWGDRFEVLVSTHLDKAHYHNHFIINSVSFKDGLRYYDNKANYQKMRDTSDRLCRKYQLSVIDKQSYKSEHYASWKDGPSIRSLIKKDIDYAISTSMTMKQFVQIMEKMGYTFKFNKHWAVLPPNGKKYIRLRSLSNDGFYSQEGISKRILEIKTVKYTSIQNNNSPKKLHGSIKNSVKLTGFTAMYFKYMYAMGILPQYALNKKKVHFLLKEDLKKLDRITKEVTLLGKKKINTLEELEFHLSKAALKKEELIKERRCIYNKIRRCKYPDRKELLKQDVATISAQIKKLSLEIKLYEDIKTRSLEMNEKTNQEKQYKEKERNDKRCLIS